MESVQFLSGNLTEIMKEILRPNFENIWMVGGPTLTKEFLRLGLADQINISIIPVLLGDGTLFFDYIRKEIALHLKDVIACKDGMVEMIYQVKKE